MKTDKASYNKLVTETKQILEEAAGSVKADREEDILEKKARGAVLFTLLPLLSLFAIILLGYFKNASITEIAKIGTLTLILTAASVFFIRMQEEDILKKKYAKSVIIIGYLISLLFIMLPIRPDIYSFWMIGGILIAMLVDTRLGLLIHINLTFILSVILSLRPETTTHFLIMGMLMGLLAGALRNKATVVYAAVILLSTNITLAFVINNFIFDANVNYNYMSSFFSIFTVLAAAFMLSCLYNTVSGMHHGVSPQEMTAVTFEKEEPERITPSSDRISAASLELPLAEAITEEEEKLSANYNRGTRTSCELLISEDNGLLQKLKEHSEAIYRHSLMIGDISGRAAQTIGADWKLAKAGGLYHEIGKINGKEYIEEGQKIAEEYSFPKELMTILRQHNIKNERPASVEAAIVMLTDIVVSTLDYIRKTEDKKYTVDKIIDNIFQMRMDKGTFDDSGLSIKDYKMLREFYLKEFR